MTVTDNTPIEDTVPSEDLCRSRATITEHPMNTIGREEPLK
jgi:hypothetical protein